MRDQGTRRDTTRCICGCGLFRRTHLKLHDLASDKRIPLELWWNTLDAAQHDPGDEDRS